MSHLEALALGALVLIELAAAGVLIMLIISMWKDMR